jgi:hypothetical protein
VQAEGGMSGSDESSAPSEKGAQCIQTSVQITPEIWAALNDLATRKRLGAGQRVTVHHLVMEGIHHVLAVDGAHPTEPATRADLVELRTALMERINQVKIELERTIKAYGR